MALAAVVLTLVLLLMPALIPMLSRLRSLPSVAMAAVVLPGIGRFLWSTPHLAIGPWMENTITPVGVLGGAQIAGTRPVVLALPVRAAMSLIVFALIAAMVAGAVVALSTGRHALTRLARFFLKPRQHEITATALVLVSIAYFGLLLDRCTLNVSFDRHLLPLIPCAAIPLLRHKRIPRISWALLAIYGMYALGSTQEELSLARARVTAVTRLENAHIPRTRISGGLEYDFWTQLEATGYINDSRIKRPPGAFHPHIGRTPGVQPKYRVEYDPGPDSVDSSFGTVNYFSLLPPFHRRLSIDRIRAR